MKSLKATLLISDFSKIGMPDLVLYLECGKAIAKARYLSRKVEGRLDDDEAMFEKRYGEYVKSNRDILAYFRGYGRLVDVCLFY